MKIRRLILVTLCALAAGLLSCGASALATRGHVFSKAFGEKGAGDGQLSEPSGVAINETSGDVYVVDSGNNRVEYFSAAGAYIGQFNGSGSDLAVEGKAAPTGRFSEAEGIAIDNDPGSPSFGDVYVADVGHEVVDKFSATGQYIGQLTETSGGSKFGRIVGLAVDSNGLLWVAQENEAVDSFSAAIANEFLSAREAKVFAGGYPGLAVDSNDNLYVKGYFYGVVKLNSAGEVLAQEFDNLLVNPDSLAAPSRVAVDLSNDEVYIDDADNEGSVGRFTSSGSLVETFGAEHLTQGSGLTVDGKTGEVYVANPAVSGVDRFVLEPEARPTVEHEAPAAVTATSAMLGAQIKPNGPSTAYYFEYGTASCAADPGSCADLPASPGVEVGEGFSAESVNVNATGLTPGVVYHFRVVAVNRLGATVGSEQSFTTQGVGSALTLVDGRSWEMVTPPEKYGAGVIAVGNEQGAAIQASESGDAITYGATSPFSAASAGSRSPEVTQVLSARSAPNEWGTQDITTRHEEGADELAVGHSAEYKLFSSNLSLGMVEPVGHTQLPPLPPGSDTEKTIYLRESNGDFEPLVSQANVPPGTKIGGNEEGAGGVEFVGGTPDMSHVAISSGLALTSNIVKNESYSLYEWSGGELRLISVLPDGKPATEEGIGASLGRGGNVRHAISNDGSRVVFEADGHLYLRDMTAGKTIQIDAAQGAVEPTSGASHYQTANSSDSRVFFTSPERLTANATATEGEDLYEFELTSGADEPLTGKLTDLTVDGNAGESADVRGVIETSEDGSYVYFVANGVLGGAAGQGAKSGKCEHTSQPFKQTCNLYVERYDEASQAWTEPQLIATLSGNDSPSWGQGPTQTNLQSMTARVSPNGRYLAFMSERSLTGYENRDANSGVPDEEVYLYDAGGSHLVCASCNPTGARPVGLLEGNAYEENLVDYGKIWQDRWFAANIPGWTTTDLTSAMYQSRYLSNSGRLFFNSSDALVPGDVNGKEDVYEYEPAGVGSCQAPGYGQSAGDVFDAGAGGCVALISAGTSAEESAFMDASESGGDVFFVTLSRLAQQDFDTSLDIYDAHECSTASPCAPAPALAPPPCTTGDSCKPAPTPQPSSFGAPASQTFSGAGNVSPTPTSTTRAKPKTAAQVRAEKLAKALKSCKKRAKAKHGSCEARARKTYGPAHKAKKTDRRAK